LGKKKVINKFRSQYPIEPKVSCKQWEVQHPIHSRGAIFLGGGPRGGISIQATIT